MKKSYILIVVVYIFFLNKANAQQIDCQYLNPKNINLDYKYIRFGESSAYYGGFMYNISNVGYGDGDDFSIYTYSDRDLTFRTGTGNVIFFPSSGGKVGIGTTNPNAKLQVTGTMLLDDPNYTYDWNSNWQCGFYQSIDASNSPETSGWFWGINMGHSSNNENYRYNGQIAIKNGSTNPTMYFRSTNSSGEGTWAKVLNNKGDQVIEGKLSIGTTNSDATLTVNGNIKAERIDVIEDVPASDFVFEEDYNLRSLADVETFVKENKHLPEIPSAEEFKENGYSVGQMDDLLLRKVEELTLYTIEQEKVIKMQESKIKTQDSKIETLDSRIQDLESENTELKTIKTELEELKKLINQLK